MQSENQDIAGRLSSEYFIRTSWHHIKGPALVKVVPTTHEYLQVRGRKHSYLLMINLAHILVVFQNSHKAGL